MSTVAQVLDWHLEHYPLLQAADVYKLVHQSVFGPGHLVKDADGLRLPAHGAWTVQVQAQAQASARRALEEERARVRDRDSHRFPPEGNRMAVPTETEPLDPDGMLVRVNLGPLGAGEVEALARVLVETARTFVPDTEKMPARLASSVEWCRSRLPEQTVWLEEMAAAAPKEGFPPAHHSAEYEAAYRPAYRVVSRELWNRAKSEFGFQKSRRF